MYGAAIFTNPKFYDPANINTGALALGHIGDSQIVKSISGTGQLANNVKWLTNISSDMAYHAQLKNTPKFLEEKYLRTAVSSIILELGMKHSSLEDKASIISEIFNNTMLLANKLFSIDDAPKGALSAGIATKIGHYQITISDPTLVDAVAKSIQPYTNCERRAEIGSRSTSSIEFVSVIIPRLQHARNLLSAGVPMDNLLWLNESQLPSKTARLNWACQSHLPLLVEVKISNISLAYSGLINWGNGAGSILGKQTYAISNERLFITNNELKHLSQFSNVEVGRIAICQSEVDSRYSLPIDNELAITSYSYGLLSENYWCALLRDRNGQYRRGFACSWLHAEDRMHCLGYAKKLSDKGYSINGYGYGRINVALRDSEKASFRQDVLSLGLLPCLESQPQGSHNFDNEIETANEMYNLIFTEGRRDLIHLLDQTFINEVLRG